VQILLELISVCNKVKMHHSSEMVVLVTGGWCDHGCSFAIKNDFAQDSDPVNERDGRMASRDDLLVVAAN
jgi:hypothetical protein